MSRHTDNTSVTGIGWVVGTSCGCVRRQWRSGGGAATRAPWQPAALFASPVKHMGRFDEVTRLILCACALGLRDAGVSYAEGRKLDFGLIGTSDEGSLAANRQYFRDYLQAGRTLARGNLFIYTLPSSPLAEAAIHFGLQGPLLYFGFPAGDGTLLHAGAGLMADGMAEQVLAVRADGQGAVAFLLGPEGNTGAGPQLTVGGVEACLKGSHSVGEWVRRLELVMKVNGVS